MRFGRLIPIAAVGLCVAFAADDARATPASSSSSTPAFVDADANPELARRRRGKKKSKKAAKPADETAGETAPAAAEAGVAATTRRGPSRVEFDERLLRGQTNKANAIYLFQRRASALRSLVKKRKHFHDEIDEALE
jgi:hypothetical protein